MRSPNQPTFVRHIDAAGYGAGQPRPMDEDDALEQAEAEIRRLKQQVKHLFVLVDEARESVVQHHPKALLWLETLDGIRNPKNNQQQ